MAQKPPEQVDDFEPDFEVTRVPIEELESIGVKSVEKVPEVGADSALVKVKEKQEGARSIFSIIFLVGFILLLFAGLILGFLMEGNQLDNTREVLLTISGILSGPLGFVIGYYFRSSEESVS